MTICTDCWEHLIPLIQFKWLIWRRGPLKFQLGSTYVMMVCSTYKSALPKSIILISFPVPMISCK